MFVHDLRRLWKKWKIINPLCTQFIIRSSQLR
jgi:hypothetical protein